MKSITVSYNTSRHRPCVEWFLDSLAGQIKDGEKISVVIVNLHCKYTRILGHYSNHRHPFNYLETPVKPTVWQGEYRLTKQDWWSAANSRNTSLCLCKTDYILWVDDRSVLCPEWLQAAREAAEAGYAVCGTYEKTHNLVVENGLVKSYTELVDEKGNKYGKDHRSVTLGDVVTTVPGGWFFGGTLGMPTEMALTINGFDECLDSLSAEDTMMGLHLANNGFKIVFDHRLKIIEDRTPSELGEPMKRTSKEKHPNDTTDKGHEALRRFGKLKRASHHWNLREIRERVLRGEPFPHHNGQPERDWFDQTLIKDMV